MDVDAITIPPWVVTLLVNLVIAPFIGWGVQTARAWYSQVNDKFASVESNIKNTTDQLSLMATDVKKIKRGLQRNIRESKKMEQQISLLMSRNLENGHIEREDVD